MYIEMSIYNELWFHLQWVVELDKAQGELETVFGKHNDICKHQLETQLVTINASDFSCIQYYLS